MHIGQFNFKPTKLMGFEEEAIVKTNKNEAVALYKKGDWITIRKIINTVVDVECKFNFKTNEKGLNTFLKNIGKK